MASLAFPALAKKATLSDGTTYGYVAAPAPAPAQSLTFLLLHGYPSSCFDWRHQIKSLTDAGYGVIAPDLLGYGDTDKPNDPSRYRMKTMASHMVKILDVEKVSACVAVGHDWGSILLSRMVTYTPDRLLGAVFVATGYFEPGFKFDIDAINAQTEQLYGYPLFGYWPWFNTPEAVADCEAHPASAFTLLYPANPQDWKANFAPVGAAKRYVTSNPHDQKLPTWYSLDDYTTRDRIMARGGHQGPMNWYKAAMRGVNTQDEADVSDEDKFCRVPSMLVACGQDYVTRADMQIGMTSKWAPRLRVESLDECGHWMQLEKPEVLHKLLTEFAHGLDGES